MKQTLKALTDKTLVVLITCVISVGLRAEPIDLPAGEYTLDRSHASLLFRVNHLGFSMFTARFVNFDAQLQFDPKNLEQSQLTVEVDATSIETDYPTPETWDFNKQLQDSDWLYTEKYPIMTYKSTKVTVVEDRVMKVDGLLTLKGVTKPVVLNVTLNGGWRGIPQDPNARVGFSARATLNRSDFNISFGIPGPSMPMGVSDEVDVIIETEFSGPAWQP
jgi:polyisoprenoid-binding protein YceI